MELIIQESNEFQYFRNVINNIDEYKKRKYSNLHLFDGHIFKMAMILHNKLKMIGIEVTELTYPDPYFCIKCKDEYISISYFVIFMSFFRSEKFHYEIMDLEGNINHFYTDEVPYSDNNIYTILDFIDNQII